MKIAVAVLLLLLLAEAASAGSITITETNGSTKASYTRTFTVPDADLTGKFEPWLSASHPNRCPRTPGKPAAKCTPVAQTTAGAFQLWAAEVVNGAVSKVAGYQRRKAMQSAAGTVAPMAAQ